MEKSFKLEAGAGLLVMSPYQYRWKMAVTNADAGPCGSLLVGPADQSGYFCPVGAVCWKWRMGQIETPSSAPVFFKKPKMQLCNYG